MQLLETISEFTHEVAGDVLSSNDQQVHSNYVASESYSYRVPVGLLHAIYGGLEDSLLKVGAELDAEGDPERREKLERVIDLIGQAMDIARHHQQQTRHVVAVLDLGDVLRLSQSFVDRLKTVCALENQQRNGFYDDLTARFGKLGRH